MTNITLTCLERSWWTSGAASYHKSSHWIWACRKRGCLVWWVFCYCYI